MSIHAQERPAGFNRPARRRPTADTPKSGKQLAAEKKRERAQEKQRRREEKRRRREEKRHSRANRTPEARRRTRGRFAAIALIVVLLGLAAIVVFGDHNRTVHQMPTILRESAETKEEMEGAE